jgi:hypothetical protein
MIGPRGCSSGDDLAFAAARRAFWERRFSTASTSDTPTNSTRMPIASTAMSVRSLLDTDWLAWAGVTSWVPLIM